MNIEEKARREAHRIYARRKDRTPFSPNIGPFSIASFVQGALWLAVDQESKASLAAEVLEMLLDVNADPAKVREMARDVLGQIKKPPEGG